MTYMIMTRSEKALSSLNDLLKQKIKFAKTISEVQSSYDTYMDILLSFIEGQYGEKNVTSMILKNYFENGYLYHTFHASFLDSVKENGLQSSVSDEEMDLVRKIFLSHGKKDIFGLHTGKNYHTLFLASSLRSSPYYGLNSPSFFKMFIHNEIEKKERYIYEDYAQNVLKLCQKYHLTTKEQEFVFHFFQERYVIYHSDPYPCVAFIPRKKYGKTSQIEDKKKEESAKDYLKRILRLYTENNVIIKENIPSCDLMIISYDHRKKQRRKIK